MAKDEAVATKVKEEAQAISDDAQKDLELALPALEAAEKSLQALNKGDIGEVKALKTPPPGVITVIETICIIKGIPPKKVILGRIVGLPNRPNLLVNKFKVLGSRSATRDQDKRLLGAGKKDDGRRRTIPVLLTQLR